MSKLAKKFGGAIGAAVLMAAGSAGATTVAPSLDTEVSVDQRGDFAFLQAFHKACTSDGHIATFSTQTRLNSLIINRGQNLSQEELDSIKNAYETTLGAAIDSTLGDAMATRSSDELESTQNGGKPLAPNQQELALGEALAKAFMKHMQEAPQAASAKYNYDMTVSPVPVPSVCK